MATLAQEARLGLRLLARNPGFTLVAITILALAIGTTTPTFVMLDAYLLRPLPFAEPERLVHVWATNARQGWNQVRVSVPELPDWRREARSFQGLAAFNYTAETLAGGDAPEEISAGRVSANTFELLGRQAALGRTFQEGEDQPGARDVVVLSDAFWRVRYQADRGVLGRALEINGRPHTIVRVMPPDFAFPLQLRQERLSFGLHLRDATLRFAIRKPLASCNLGHACGERRNHEHAQRACGGEDQVSAPAQQHRPAPGRGGSDHPRQVLAIGAQAHIAIAREEIAGEIDVRKVE